MRRALALLAVVAVVLAAWAGYERVRGPSAGPLPAAFPAIVRRPPALAFAAEAAPPVRPAGGPTGRHVGIAIIDGPLLVEHREYADRLRWYDEIDVAPGDPARWHATAVASIAAGRTVGVAPEADLYFVGVGVNWTREPPGNLFTAFRRGAHTGQTLPLAIRRILAVNHGLPADRKIRAISISVGGGASLWDAVAEARREGLFVSAADLRLGRLGPVTVASPAGPAAYTTFKVPAGSWAIAYWAGRYALACQQDPSMTPARFLGALKRKPA